MEIYLDGIGLIQDSTVKLDGLTIITGENNSGKSTVGKALYAITDGMIDIDLKQERDEVDFCQAQIATKLKGSIQALFQIDEAAQGFDIFRHGFAKEYTPAVSQILSTQNTITFENRQDLLLFLENLTEEISNLRFYDNNVEHFENKSKNTLNTENITKNTLKEAILGSCDAIKQFILDDNKIHNFREKYINYVLAGEFFGEIQPVKNKNIISTISFKNKNGIILDCNIKDNSIISKSFKSISHEFSKIFFIDNAFIINSIKPINLKNTNTNNTLTQNHTIKLINYLGEEHTPNISHENSIAHKYEKIRQAINNILPGSLKFTPQGLKYEHEGVSLRAVNLATGSKMFAIIKMILDKYSLDDSTMLILDEPEAHLHPKWQNAFAEVIVLLVKELGVRVLLASHSAHFVLALDAQMRTYDIIKKTNFYKTSKQENDFVKYELVNDDLTSIYDDFATYYAVSKYIRDSNYYGENE